MQFTNVIYQIGRLDNNIKNVTFKIKDYKKESELSSLVFKEYRQRQKNEASHVVLLYPVSLPLNKTLINVLDPFPAFKETIMQAIEQPHSYLQNPARVFDIMPYYAEKDTYLILHSLGTYLGVEFQSSFNDIILEIFLDMLDRYLQQGFRHLYLDVSTGLNIYVTALLEAGRLFGTWARLRHWQNKTEAPRVHLVYTDPIIGGTAEEYNIYEQDLEFKIFFSSPITRDDVKESEFCQTLLNRIYPRSAQDQAGKEKREQLKGLLENYVYIFSALKNNTPLFIYYAGYHQPSQIHAALYDLIAHARSLLQNDYHTSPNLCRTSYTKAILALGFYLGMVEVLQARKVTWREEVSVPARQFKDTFKNIYHKFGLPLNYTFLGNEINSLENKIKKTKLEPEKWYTVATLEQRKPGNPDKRNFFAHSGMEKNLTEFLASPAEIYFCYTHQYIDQQGQEQDSISLIKKWLREEV